MEWHDCSGEATPSEQIIGDILALSAGTLNGLVAGTHVAVTDGRDARIAADALRR